MAHLQENSAADGVQAAAPAAREHPRQQQQRIEKVFARKGGRPGAGLKSGLCVIAMVWATAFAYWRYMPQVYVSQWSLIVPVSNSSSSVNLESIGQASTAPTQPFGVTHLSPKVIYKEIATSDQVRNKAALLMGMKGGQFGKPRVRLIDETSLLNFQINGGTAHEARAKGLAVIEALNQQLDSLRRDEFERRANLVRENLKLYQATVDRARERIVDFQRQTGLLSLQQFTEAATSGEMLRRKLSEKRTEIEKSQSELDRMRARVGLDAITAIRVLRLAGDPTFTQLCATYSEAATNVQEMALRLGQRHPTMVTAMLKQQGTLQEIERKARAAGLEPGIDIGTVVMLLNDSHFSDLLQKMVGTDTTVTGSRHELESLDTEARRLDAVVARMGEDAARLEALRKDHLVAEAVFSSAAARLDTNRTDLFSSYPLLQVLSEPDLAERRSQPRLIYAIAAGVLGTLMVIFAWGAAWVHLKFVRRRWKSG
jgi:uncharacterized protein involved in exopolysaccharide biosynthesis